MDRLTANTIAKHLDVTRANLNLASYTPVEHALTFLEDALHNLEAAVDTLREARTAESAFCGIDNAHGSGSTAVLVVPNAA